MQSTVRAFHVMAKPTGAKCNIDCEYCFFLKKETLYPNSNFRMGDDVMESYIEQTVDAHNVPQVTIAWQGGEPTLMGLDFFKRAVAYGKTVRKPGVQLENTIQTNGILLDDEWCKFLAQHKFLVGLSLDGPREMHDTYRKDKGGKPTFNKVMRALRLLQRHGVDFNILCTVNAVNSMHPLEVYRFYRDEVKAKYIQLIPIVERVNENGDQEGTLVSDRSVRPEQYGHFLNAIWDEWVHRDVGEMFIQFFDGVLISYVRGYSSLCILRPTCGDGVALEHNGDVYSCDHFVEPKHLLGNIMEKPLAELVNSEQQRAFGQAKQDTLPKYCRECEFLFTCHGECPKNRVLTTPDGEPGLNWLCAGLKLFFSHTQQTMRVMADLMKRGRPASDIMPILLAEEIAKAGRNDPCPCRSGQKLKKCHGR